MNNKYTVFLILAILLIAFLWNKNEHLDAAPLSNEAIQSIASVYNKDNLTATNIRATGSIANGSTTLSGNTLSDTGRFHISSGELLYLLPKKGVIIGADWGGNGNLTVAGTIKGSLSSPNGTRRLIIDNDGYIVLTDGNGTPIPAKIRKGQLWSDKNDYYVMASNLTDKGVVQGYGSDDVKVSYAAGTRG